MTNGCLNCRIPISMCFILHLFPPLFPDVYSIVYNSQVYVFGHKPINQTIKFKIHMEYEPSRPVKILGFDHILLY